jgi:U6 snRNA-associated Sm-like protein LSm4
MNECYIRGSTIKYLRIPDEVIDLVKEDVQKMRRGGDMNKQQNRQGGGGNQQNNRNFGNNKNRNNPNNQSRQHNNNRNQPQQK